VKTELSPISLCLVAFLGLVGCQGTSALRFDNLSPNASVVIAPVVNATHEALRLPPDNPLSALRQALNVGDETPLTVPDVLLGRFLRTLQSAGHSAALLKPSPEANDIVSALDAARGVGFTGVLVLPVLLRWDDSLWFSSKVVFVSMDVTLARINDGKILGVRTLRRRAVPVGGAVTMTQAADDAARWLAERLF
jgi:hypothetical protein